MRLPILLAALTFATLAAAHADDRVDACVVASAAVGAPVNPSQAGVSDNSISFAVSNLINQAVGITCVFDPAAKVPTLTKFYWRFSPNGAGDIAVAPINAILALRFPAAGPDPRVAMLQAMSDHNDADLAFTCAAWANVDDGRSIDREEIERLTMLGYDLSLKAAAPNKSPAMLAEQSKDRALYERAPLDFWVGAQWVQVNDAVNRGLEHDVPYANQGNDAWQAARAANASAKYQQQDCAKLGL